MFYNTLVENKLFPTYAIKKIVYYHQSNINFRSNEVKVKICCAITYTYFPPSGTMKIELRLHYVPDSWCGRGMVSLIKLLLSLYIWQFQLKLHGKET